MYPQKEVTLLYIIPSFVEAFIMVFKTVTMEMKEFYGEQPIYVHIPVMSLIVC